VDISSHNTSGKCDAGKICACNSCAIEQRKLHNLREFKRINAFTINRKIIENQPSENNIEASRQYDLNTVNPQVPSSSQCGVTNGSYWLQEIMDTWQPVSCYRFLTISPCFFLRRNLVPPPLASAETSGWVRFIRTWTRCNPAKYARLYRFLDGKLVRVRPVK